MLGKLVQIANGRRRRGTCALRRSTGAPTRCGCCAFFCDSVCCCHGEKYLPEPYIILHDIKLSTYATCICFELCQALLIFVEKLVRSRSCTRHMLKPDPSLSSNPTIRGMSYEKEEKGIYPYSLGVTESGIWNLDSATQQTVAYQRLHSAA